MNLEEFYQRSAQGYVEFVEILVDVARNDPETTKGELAYLVGHLEFAKSLLETLTEEIGG